MGEGFEEQVWQALCDQTQIWRPHIRCPTLGLTEKFSCSLNKVIEEGLLTYHPFLLSVASFAYDTKVHLDLGQTPFELGRGRPAIMPITFGTSDELGENEAVRTQGTLR